MKLLLLALVMPLLIQWTHGEIIAYNCQDETVELTKLSLLKVKPCLDPRNATDVQTKKIQLIQKRHYVGIHVYTCLVTVEQSIQYCGMHSHTSPVQGGFGKYVQYLTPEVCFKAHRFRHLDLRAIGAGIVSKLNLNGTTEISTTLQGELTIEGRCSGVKFAVGEVEYQNVIVLGAITIKLSDYATTADTERNLVNLRSGTVCPYNDMSCFDDNVGELIWQVNKAHQCTNQGVDVLYEDNATLLTLSRDPPTFYVLVDTDDTVFALKLTKPVDQCHQRAWQTEQNRLVVILEDSLGFFYRTSLRLPQNTDMMAHVLSKLLYLEIAFKRQMADIVYDAILKRCQLREKILTNRITIALQSPDLIGNLVKETTGYTGRVMGEVLYIAKCTPVVVEYRRTTTCYQELPVTYKNQSMFRTPISHIITKHGTEIDCQPLLPANFFVDLDRVDAYYQKGGTSHATQREHRGRGDHLSQNIADNIKRSLHQGGYGDVPANLMFPNERKSVINEVARRVTGRGIGADNMYMPNLFSESEFKNIARSAAEEVWGFLSRMGNIFSICGFIYTSFYALSYVAGVVMNYFTIRKVARNHPHRNRYLWASFCQTLAHRYIYRLHREDSEAVRGLKELSGTRVDIETMPESSSAGVTPTIATAPPTSAEVYPNLVPCYLHGCAETQCSRVQPAQQGL